MMLLDDVDHQLVELLGTSGRTTNRVLASKVGLTEATVAARLRRLADGDVLTVRPQFDWVAAGFTVHALVFLRVKGIASTVAHALAQLRDVHSVSVLLGDHDVLLSVVSPSPATLHELVAELLERADVVALHVEQTVDFLRYEMRTSKLPVNGEVSVDDFPAPAIALDDLDRDIIATLRLDGRASFRKIAQKVGVSDGTVGGRVRKLADAGLMRIRAFHGLSDRHRIIALVLVSVARPVETARTLVDLPQVTTCATTTGSSNLLVFISGPSISEIHRWIEEHVSVRPGLRDLRSWLVVDTVFMKPDLVRFV
jgi:DNA-binding Lrp family transcriptional regulator